MIRYANYHIFIVMNIDSIIRNERKSVEKLRDLSTKLSISRLITILEYQTWYQIKAKTWFFKLMVVY